jgi:hypothetical protein
VTNGIAGPRPLHARVRARVTSPSDVVLMMRMMGWACVLPALKHLVPLTTLAPLMRRPPRQSTRDRAREDQIVTFARWVCRATRWSRDGNCLERGLVAYRFLCAANAAPSLVVGVAPAAPSGAPGDDGSGNVRGHAWVVVDGQPVGERAATLAEFAFVLAFGPDGSLLVQNPFAIVDAATAALVRT